MSGKANTLVAVSYWTPIFGRMADADDPIDPGGTSVPFRMVTKVVVATTLIDPRNTGRIRPHKSERSICKLRIYHIETLYLKLTTGI